MDDAINVTMVMFSCGTPWSISTRIAIMAAAPVDTVASMRNT